MADTKKDVKWYLDLIGSISNFGSSLYERFWGAGAPPQDVSLTPNADGSTSLTFGNNKPLYIIGGVALLIFGLSFFAGRGARRR